MLPRFRRFGTIEKVEKNEDGTINVFGFASTELRDSQDEVIRCDAMREAAPDYMKWGAIREMHQPKAAGTALTVTFDDQNRTYIGVHVVDPIAVTKVLTNVYKAFSIGGKVLARDATDSRTITKIQWIETSLVDRPSNPGAEIVVVKCETGDETVPEPVKTEETPAEAPEPETVRKGMYQVSWLADVLAQLNSVRVDAAWEAANEGDGSMVPAKLKIAVEQLAAILVEMLTEEAAELTADQTIIYLAAKTTFEKVIILDHDAIEKAGKRFSKGTKTALAKMHAAMKECCDGMDKLGYADAEEHDEQVEGENADKLAKVSGDLAALQADAIEKANKLTAMSTELEKANLAITAEKARADEAEADLHKAHTEIAAAVEQMKAKGGLFVIEKSGEIGTPLGEGATEPVVKSPAIDPKKDYDAGVSSIRKIHAGGGTVLRNGQR